MDEWVTHETGQVDFGDVRLTRRLGLVVSALAAAPTDSIPGSHLGGDQGRVPLL
jgi:hypothetical protein